MSGDDGRDPDPLVGELRNVINDVVGSEDIVVLVGYFGEGVDGAKRIYRDPELQEYVEVPGDEILWREQVDPPDEFGARSAIWVRRSDMEREIHYPEGTHDALSDAGLGFRIPETRLDAAARMAIVCRPMTKSRCATAWTSERSAERR
jgi:hypothetical protein